jgi:hypothetical protein
MCAYIFIDNYFYRQNKKPINKFINQDEYICRYYFKKNSDLKGMVEIYVEQVDNFEDFVEYMFRMLREEYGCRDS